MYRSLMIALALFLLFGTSPVLAKTFYRSPKEQPTINHVTNVSRACIGHWEKQSCLQSVSSTALTLTAKYAETLNQKGQDQAIEYLKEYCAAATAATKGEYPAEAMRSAYTECVNIIADLSDKTGMKPNPEYYQLLVGAVLCLNKNKNCTYVEQGLSKYK